mmetsp:Transcript_19211/g.42037  ORF Transcript_19211/g.42037 Transcript_19211/m.42037 type:complete len:275 (-) Transcript_19211:155-979(-)
MNHVLLVAIHQCLRQGGDVGRRALLAESSDHLQLLIKLPTGSVLQDKVDAVLVVEITVETQDVRVPEVRLDLNLATQLMLDVTLLQLGLEKNLESHDVLALLLTSEVNVAELPPSQRLAYVKVHEAPPLGLRRSLGCRSAHSPTAVTLRVSLLVARLRVRGRLPFTSFALHRGSRRGSFSVGTASVRPRDPSAVHRLRRIHSADFHIARVRIDHGARASGNVHIGSTGLQRYALCTTLGSQWPHSTFLLLALQFILAHIHRGRRCKAEGLGGGV